MSVYANKERISELTARMCEASENNPEEYFSIFDSEYDDIPDSIFRRSGGVSEGFPKLNLREIIRLMTQSTFDALEGSSSISGYRGNLLFSTDGVDVYDRWAGNQIDKSDVFLWENKLLVCQRIV